MTITNEMTTKKAIKEYAHGAVLAGPVAQIQAIQPTFRGPHLCVAYDSP